LDKLGSACKGGKEMKLGLLTVLVGVALAVSVPLMMAETGAFHDVAHLQCNKCHTMHYSEGGGIPTIGSGFGWDAEAGGPFPHLLLKKNITDLCLACHDAPTISPDVFNASIETPGGDFKHSGTNGDETKGHNPGGAPGNVSLSIPLDSVLGLTPPGGAVLTRWTCVECHYAHGSTDGAFMFRNVLKFGLTSSNFVAGDNEECDIWDGSSANIAQSSTNHNVYKTSIIGNKSIGFGRWCAVCHGDYHGAARSDSKVGDGADWWSHPTATALPASYLSNYYGTSNYTYPLETANSSASITAEWAQSQGNEGVTCLTCHKAHASEYANATRWDNATASGSGTGCNKCHNKGE